MSPGVARAVFFVIAFIVITSLVLQYFFRDVNLQKVQLSVYDFNTRAVASYRKCGFEVEGVRRNIAYVHGEWCDSIEMAVTAEQFERLESLWNETQPIAEAASSPHD